MIVYIPFYYGRLSDLLYHKVRKLSITSRVLPIPFRVTFDTVSLVSGRGVGSLHLTRPHVTNMRTFGHGLAKLQLVKRVSAHLRV